jgi:hypothetical protein
MGRHAKRRALLGLSIQAGRVQAPDDMDRGVGPIGGLMGDWVCLSVLDRTPGLILELIAEQTQKRDDPLLTGFGGCRNAGLQDLYFSLKNSPIVLRIGPGPGDLILDLNGAVESEIRGSLADCVLQPLQDVRGKDGAFYADTGVDHDLLFSY